jgi:hypothetical protein
MPDDPRGERRRLQGQDETRRPMRAPPPVQLRPKRAALLRRVANRGRGPSFMVFFFCLLRPGGAEKATREKKYGADADGCGLGAGLLAWRATIPGGG